MGIKKSTSLRSVIHAKVEIISSIALFAYGSKRYFKNDYCDISKSKGGWNVLELKFRIPNFKLPDIPHVVINYDADDIKFKFDLSYSENLHESLIINKSDLTIGQKVLLLIVLGLAPVEKNEFWEMFYERMPKEFISKVLNEEEFLLN